MSEFTQGQVTPRALPGVTREEGHPEDRALRSAGTPLHSPGAAVTPSCGALGSAGPEAAPGA